MRISDWSSDVCSADLAFAHVTRCFDDPDVIHVAGSPDPIRDIEIINTELGLADLDSVTKAAERLAKTAKSGNKEALAKYELLKRMQAHLDSGQPARSLALEPEEKLQPRDTHLRSEEGGVGKEGVSTWE